MPKRRRNRGTVVLPTTLEQTDAQLQRLSIHKDLMFQKLVESSKPDDIMKALSYQQNMNKTTKTTTDQQKAFLYAPDNEFYTGMGYKTPIKVVPFEYLRSMGQTPMIFSVISTRINQILDFSSFTDQLDRPGWTIKKKVSRFAGLDTE